jgi:hypothetical protein
MMEVVKQAQQSCSTDCRSVLALASTALCEWWGVPGVWSVQMDRSDMEEFRGKMVGWLSQTSAGMVISHVYWLDPPIGAGLLWIKPLDFASQPIAPRGGQLRGNDTGLVWPAG